MSLFDRLTGDGTEEGPKIGLHGFLSILNEYVRGEINKTQIGALYTIDVGDSQAWVMFGLIDGETGVQDKLLMVRKIYDVLVICESNDTNQIYPNKAAVVARLLS